LTTAKKSNAQRFAKGVDVRPLTRRRFFSTLLSGLASAYAAPSLLDCLGAERGLLVEAAELSREAVTVDLHCHPNKLGGPHFPELDPDVPSNMKAGGLDAGLFAVRGDYPIIRRDSSGRRYESRQPKAGELFRRSQDQLDRILAAIKTGKLALAQSPMDILNAKKNGTPCAVLSIEGSDPLEGDVSRVRFFYDRGVRVLQLVHYRINEIGDIQTSEPRHNGLTSFGREVVREMNRLGMVIDTAHCSSDTLNHVLAASRQPVILSHTGPYALRQIARNVEDKDMMAIAKKGGVIGIWPLRRRRETIETMFKEVDYVKKLVGADHVGIATDLFGLGDLTSIPTHKEFALVPAGLLSRGYSASDVEKIVGGNFIRVFRDVTETRGQS
jgi:membrane dipeptidase